VRPRLLIRAAAERDLRSIADYLAVRSVTAALRFGEAADKAFAQLLDFPHSGARLMLANPRLVGLRAWHITGFRQYRIFDLPTSERIEILRVLHGARDLEGILGSTGDDDASE